MVKQLYGIEVAELILKRYCDDWVDFTGDGVFVKKELVESPDASQVFEWTPACEMDWDDAPDPLTHPALSVRGGTAQSVTSAWRCSTGGVSWRAATAGA